MTWERRSSRYLYESHWYNVRQDELTLPSGEDITYTMIEHPGYALVVPLLPDGRVVMERVYRYTVDQVLLECPSGGLDGEPPDVAAKRELEEETGYRAREVEPLGSFYSSSGNGDERFHLFLARDVVADGTITRESTEEIEIELIPFDELVERALRAELNTGPSALAILLADARLRAGRRT